MILRAEILLRHFDRIVLLDRMIRSGRAVSKKCLAQELCLSESRVESLLKHMRGAGLPVWYNPRTGRFEYHTSVRFTARIEYDGEAVFDYDSEKGGCKCWWATKQ